MYFRGILAAGLVLWAQACDAEGAVAFGSNGRGMAVGIAWNRSSASDAASIAVQRCEQHGASCSVHRTFSGACFALVLGHGQPPKYHWSTSGTREDAENRARSRCQSDSGSCELKTSGCDTLSQGLEPERELPSAPPAPEYRPPTTPSSPPVPSNPRADEACRRYPNLC
jgi:hypothetical protein